MKYSKDNLQQFLMLKYIKDLVEKSVLLILTLFLIFSNYSWGTINYQSQNPTFNAPTVGANRFYLYLDSLKGKKVGLVGNQTSLVDNTHLVDTLLSKKINIVKVFSPEHGFRGNADAGESVDHSKDKKTGLPIISLYGKSKKPSRENMRNIDIMIFDIQDVGVRFYTYLSTLHYVMEACAENNIPLLVLDRPNPNGHYIDGPVLEPDQKSFVGLHPVPIVYGMTIGEYGLMINGEKWLKNNLKCKLWVVPCDNYVHKYPYSLPVPPSPNLRTYESVCLYPSLCLFEATTVSVGRGTSRPFEIFGHPDFPESDFYFTPVSCYGAKKPLHENTRCYGFDIKDLHPFRQYKLDLTWLIQAKKLLGEEHTFINQHSFFNLLAGNTSLQEQINNNVSEEEIRSSWKPGIEKFKQTRKKYLLYD